MASGDSSEEQKVKENVEEKLVIHMNIGAHQLLSKLLRPSFPGHDWKSLADKMGFTYEEILNLECDLDPVESIVRHWERQSGATIARLLLFLNDIERLDVIEDLQPFISNTPTPSEKEELRKKKVLENYGRSPAVSELPIELERLTVSDEIFDGFICYAKEDRSFALEILTRLESPPYCRKICIDFRDYVPGNCGLDQTAKIIEYRCKHLVAILSPNFTNSSNAGFQVRIALNLSPNFLQRKVIPILYESCDVPEILKPIYHLSYEDSVEQQYFWKRLAIALGYKEAGKQKGSLLIEKKLGSSSPQGSPRGSPETAKKLNVSNKQTSRPKEKSVSEKKIMGLRLNIRNFKK